VTLGRSGFWRENVAFSRNCVLFLGHAPCWLWQRRDAGEARSADMVHDEIARRT